MGDVIILPTKRALRPEGLLHPRGIAASGFPPLRKIPHCCLPQESGPCLSASVADRPLRPATRRRPGEPLPHRLADGTRPPPRAPELSTPIPRSGSHPVLALLSKGCPGPGGRLATRYSPVRRSNQHRSAFRARLACVRRAASVRPEPGSNSRITESLKPKLWFQRFALYSLRVGRHSFK